MFEATLEPECRNGRNNSMQMEVGYETQPEPDMSGTIGSCGYALPIPKVYLASSIGGGALPSVRLRFVAEVL